MSSHLVLLALSWASIDAWLVAHKALLLTGALWSGGALVVNLIFAHVSPAQLVALFAKNRWGAFAISAMRALGLDPAGLLTALQRLLNAKSAIVTPQVVAELPPAIQAVVKNPALLVLLEGHARTLMVRRSLDNG